jgi:c-di-GMP-binding flagellar brake protein YcgR
MAEEAKFRITNPAFIQRYLYRGAPVLVFYKLDEKFEVKKIVLSDSSSDDFLIRNPFQDDPRMSIEPGTVLYFKIYPRDGYYVEFRAEVIELFERDGRGYLRMVFPESILRVQRRKAYRVPVILPAYLLPEDHGPGDYLNGDFGEPNACIHDLSLGGALVATNMKTREFGKAVLVFSLNMESRPFELDSVIRRIHKITHIKSKYLFHLGMEFSKMKEATNQKLSRYITQLQLKERAKRNR